MQSDDVVWSVIGHQFCSYKVKTTVQNFCRNEYNATGFCNRQSCPLANSRYATVREKDGTLYLYVKTIERAHSPVHMWERIKLPNSYSKALERIDNELPHWPNFLVHKCKQRITRITQYLIKMRKLKLRQEPQLMGVKKKSDRREAVRERKALAAAHLENSIEKELLERLKSKAYGDAPLNVNEHVWQAILSKEKGSKFASDLIESDMQDVETEEKLEEPGDGAEEREFISDISDDDSMWLSDLEDVADFGEATEEATEDESSNDEACLKDGPNLRKRRKSHQTSSKSNFRNKRLRSGASIEVEYEQEVENVSLANRTSTY